MDNLMPMKQGAYGQPVLQNIDRQRKLAEQLRKQSSDPLQGQMVSGHFIPPAWTQQLARVLQAGQAGSLDRNANTEEAAYSKTKAQRIAELLTSNNARTTQQGTTDTSEMPAFTPEQQDRFGSPIQGVERQPVVTSTPNMVTESADQVQARQRATAYQLANDYPDNPAIALALNDMNHDRDRQERQTDVADQRSYEGTTHARNRNEHLEDVNKTQEFQRIMQKEQFGQQLTMQEKGFVQAFKLQKQNQNFTAGQNALNRGQQERLSGSNAAPVQVLDPTTGKPVYVPRNQAIGMRPYSAADDAKQIKADEAITAKKQGASIVDSNIALLRDAYKQLDDNGGIVSSSKGSLDNLDAKVSSSGIGQYVGGAVGTKNQTQRDMIEQTRPLLLQSIMKATGMSAKQMDSNAELKLWLSTATDPTKSLEANRAALDNIERMYGSGVGNTTSTKGWGIEVVK